MATFLLDKETYERIAKELPDTNSVWGKVLNFEPSFISTQFPHTSMVPVASVCLMDAAQTLQECCYGLKEAMAHQILYEEQQSPSNFNTSIFFRRYYYDDVAFRLYSAGEDLATSIIFMLEIDGTDLQEYKEKYTSQQSIVGKFLKYRYSSHPITKAISKLIQTKDWLSAMAYRSKCVHEQPPIIKNCGIVYHRSIKWSISPDGKSRKLSIGKREEPKYSIDEIFAFIKNSLFIFTETFNEIIDYYIQILEGKGLIFDFDNNKLKYSIKFKNP